MANLVLTNDMISYIKRIRELNENNARLRMETFALRKPLRIIEEDALRNDVMTYACLGELLAHALDAQIDALVQQDIYQKYQEAK